MIEDSKVILLDAGGKVCSFQMNHKCTAGTGRFLEMMTVSLGFGLEAFGKAAAETNGNSAITSMCAIFAESAVVSLQNHGIPPAEIVRSVHLAIASRLAATDYVGNLENLKKGFQKIDAACNRQSH